MNICRRRPHILVGSPCFGPHLYQLRVYRPNCVARVHSLRNHIFGLVVEAGESQVRVKRQVQLYIARAQSK